MVFEDGRPPSSKINAETGVKSPAAPDDKLSDPKYKHDLCAKLVIKALFPILTGVPMSDDIICTPH